MSSFYSIKKRSLTSGGGDGQKTDGIVATVKDIDKAHDINQKKVKVKLTEDGSSDAFFIPKKYARDLKPEHTYEFHLEETGFRGSSESRLSGVKMTRRIIADPVEVTGKQLSKSIRGGGGIGTSR